MPITNEEGKYLTCPKCNSIFVDYDFHQKRFRCLEWECGWKEEKENGTKDYNSLVIDEESRKTKNLRE